MFEQWKGRRKEKQFIKEATRIFDKTLKEFEKAQKVGDNKTYQKDNYDALRAIYLEEAKGFFEISSNKKKIALTSNQSPNQSKVTIEDRYKSQLVKEDIAILSKVDLLSKEIEKYSREKNYNNFKIGITSRFTLITQYSSYSYNQHLRKYEFSQKNEGEFSKEIEEKNKHSKKNNVDCIINFQTENSQELSPKEIIYLVDYINAKQHPNNLIKLLDGRELDDDETEKHINNIKYEQFQASPFYNEMKDFRDEKLESFISYNKTYFSDSRDDFSEQSTANNISTPVQIRKARLPKTLNYQGRRIMDKALDDLTIEPSISDSAKKGLENACGKSVEQHYKEIPEYLAKDQKILTENIKSKLPTLLAKGHEHTHRKTPINATENKIDEIIRKQAYSSKKGKSKENETDKEEKLIIINSKAMSKNQLRRDILNQGTPSKLKSAENDKRTPTEAKSYKTVTSKKAINAKTGDSNESGTVERFELTVEQQERVAAISKAIREQLSNQLKANKREATNKKEMEDKIIYEVSNFYQETPAKLNIYKESAAIKIARNLCIEIKIPKEYSRPTNQNINVNISNFKDIIQDGLQKGRGTLENKYCSSPSQPMKTPDKNRAIQPITKYNNKSSDEDLRDSNYTTTPTSPTPKTYLLQAQQRSTVKQNLRNHPRRGDTHVNNLNRKTTPLGAGIS